MLFRYWARDGQLKETKRTQYKSIPVEMPVGAHILQGPKVTNLLIISRWKKLLNLLTKFQACREWRSRLVGGKRTKLQRPYPSSTSHQVDESRPSMQIYPLLFMKSKLLNLRGSLIIPSPNPPESGPRQTQGTPLSTTL